MEYRTFSCDSKEGDLSSGKNARTADREFAQDLSKKKRLYEWYFPERKICVEEI